MKIRIKGVGSFTCKRKDMLRGLEPDKCWYIRSLDAIRGILDIDLDIHPPPDLALEVDITHSSLDRLGIYESLRIPELWRLEHGKIHVYILNAQNRYTEVAQGLAFPGVPIAEIVRFMEVRVNEDDTAAYDAVQSWVSDVLKLSVA
jgi:Uma2 family endonuclease